MAHTNWNVLQDQTAWQIIHTGPEWLRTVIKELCVFSIAIWKQRQNTELHGTDGAISLEQHRKETATKAVAVYQATIGNLSQTDSIVLHHARIDEILNQVD
jgi:predicted dehydrogenase